jgi:hypothetical protein
MFKRNIVAGLVGIVIVGGFLGLLCIWLKAVPLILISAGVMALGIYDLFTSVKDIADARET